MSHKKFIVITSIFPPTTSIKKFNDFEDCTLIVIGDKKTPLDWKHNGTSYFSIEAQIKLEFNILEYLPFNHYSRKMIGYLIAIRNGAEYIIDSDDDNIPNLDWNFPKFNDSFLRLKDNLGFVNIYQLFTQQKIWPRGLPLNLISKNFELEKKYHFADCNVGVWQGLADEDPDVDAIYRLTNNTSCYFNKINPVVLGKGTISPFNSQNTMFRKELFPLLYLPAFVTFRFTDILRGLVAQPIMWLYDFSLGFSNATVVQERNPHDYLSDFKSELPMYQHAGEVIQIISKNIRKDNTISENLFIAYESLNKAGIVESKELILLEAWLKDVEKKS